MTAKDERIIDRALIADEIDAELPSELTLSREAVQALLDGKCVVAHVWEYETFITMEPEHDEG